MTAIKPQAFRMLVDWRQRIRQAGGDSLAQHHPRLRAALRMAYRSMYRTLEPSGLLTADVGGLRMSADPKQRDLALILLGERAWEPEQTRLFESLLRPGMVVVDVGAHVGYYTLLAARCVGRSGRVYAFEPAPENFGVLQHNIAQNNLANVVAEQLAVTRQSSLAKFTISEVDSASHTLATSLVRGREIEVRTVSLDDYFASNGTPIDVMKLDAEGAEADILDGMPHLLAQNQNLVLFTEIYPRAMEALGNSPEAFLEKLAELGFSVVPFEESNPHQTPLDASRLSSWLAELRARGTGVNLLCERGHAFEGGSGNSHSKRPARPLVSIAIPTYNRGALLERTLASILAQLPDDFEVVICDTGSTDDTCTRLARIARNNLRVSVFSFGARLSLDEALLRLLELSRGEYIWFFSSDDRMQPGATQAVRERIVSSRERPALVYINQEIVNETGETLIASQVGLERDLDFENGREILSRLGLNLGFLSASVIPLERARRVASARDFIGTRSLNLHLYLECLLEGGRALYIAKPLVQARRASGAPPYSYSQVFVSGIVNILTHARQRGFGKSHIYRAMHRIIATQYLRLAVSWRADDPAELARTFPVMRRVCWKYPAFWLLVVPVRMAPRWLVRGIRNLLREWRDRRIRTDQARISKPERTESITRTARA